MRRCLAVAGRASEQRQVSHNRYSIDKPGKLSQQGDPGEQGFSTIAVEPIVFEQVLAGELLWAKTGAVLARAAATVWDCVRKARRVLTKIAAPLLFSYTLMFGFSFPFFQTHHVLTDCAAFAALKHKGGQRNSLFVPRGPLQSCSEPHRGLPQQSSASHLRCPDGASPSCDAI